MKKVLLVGTKSYTRITGVSIAFDILIEALDELELEYRIVDRSILGEPNKAGSFDILRSIRSLLLIFKYLTSLFSCQIIYNILAPSKWGFIRDFLIIWIAVLGRKRIVLHLHGGGYLEFYNSQGKLFKKIIRTTLGKSNSFIVLDDCLKDQFSFVQNHLDRTHVVPNTSPTQIISSISKTLGNQRQLKLLFLSNLIESKGYLDVLKACQILKEREIVFSCNFCGKFVQTSVDESQKNTSELEESDQDRFSKIARRFQVSEYVNFHGVVSGAEKENLLKEASLFLLPSYYPWEGQPISLIEAISFGIPCISTNHKGIPGIVIDQYNGILVNKCSPKEIAEAICMLWNDHSMYETFSRNSKILFNTKFSKKAHVTRIIAAIYGSKEIHKLS